jgi:hypothetical protein
MRFEPKHYKEVSVVITTSLLPIFGTKYIQFWIYFYCFKLLVKLVVEPQKVSPEKDYTLLTPLHSLMGEGVIEHLK